MLPSPLRPLGLITAVAALLAGCGSSSAPGPPVDALTLVPVDSGYDFSVFVTAPPGDTHRLLVVERGGRIRLRKDGVLQDSAFLNLTGLTNPSTGEYGVYSLAFHPDYASNRRLFVYYADLNGDSQLAEYRADAGFDHVDPTSRRTILSQAQDPTTVLYGGLVSFGPDGMLYLGLGDGSPIAGIWDRAQDSTSLLGKILRLDVDAAQPYAIPADNPYVGRAGWRGEIWHLGLRNPWRWSFDRGTGDLWI
ncbi:MAG TPA: PQQ-dependent sugar dehydrogenase, partial [Gemmatimonadales bacterium]|nr:PQQ-dependent sugar dehydrogenase [Gemmatimonadales bacterium]